MGMAASQARHLALVARKSNCEYEGQQINQARTALANQSANLFNQMLGLSVPVPPSTQDFTKTQYSYTDGINSATIESWQQLAETDENYNYVVTHYSYSDIYTGSQKLLKDPQVQFSQSVESITDDYATQVAIIQEALTKLNLQNDTYELQKASYQSMKNNAASLSYYRDKTAITKVTNSELGDDGNYTITQEDGNQLTFEKWDQTSQSSLIEEAVKTWNENGCSVDLDDVYYYDGKIALRSELDALRRDGFTDGETILPVYYIDNAPEGINSIEGVATALEEAKSEVASSKSKLDEANAEYYNKNIPEYVGNCELVPIAELSKDQKAELEQVMKDMTTLKIDTNFDKYYNIQTGEYSGGIYQFKLNGVTYYTTYDDLADSAVSGEGINHIDNQNKLAYYNATYVSTKLEETKKALLETDESGRFVSIRFEDDSITYQLNMETTTDEAAYEDAMNQYYYENAKYDKLVQDINAKTSIIQQQDQQLELRLKQLDTERQALSAEIDAVTKVLNDNIDKSFKTFAN